MDAAKIADELVNYERELAEILSRFKRTQSGIHIGDGDAALFMQYVHELIDLFKDALGPNSYGPHIAAEFNEGVSNYLNSPSYKSVESVLSIVRAAVTRFRRGSILFAGESGNQVPRRRENIFIIHGHDEAKWRELSSLLRDRFKLSPIVLLEQPDAGAPTVIEKFEQYAPTCAYAIALFTPDDQVANGSEMYFQGRPNVIYELGWFCAALGRNHVMLLLKEGTTLFSDFGGIIQKRFRTSISERIAEIERDLVFAGILDEAR